MRSNAGLKREVETLKIAVVEEQDKAKSGVDWKTQCMRTHLNKGLRIEELEAEVEVLRVANGELSEGLEMMREGFVKEESEGSEESILGRDAVTVADLPPSEVFCGTGETVEKSQLVATRKSNCDSVGGVAGRMVLLGCLLAALALRL